MGNDGFWGLHAGGWRRRAGIALAIFCGLVVIFHRPVLLSVGRRIALHYAARENLKIDFRLEGNVFTNLTIKNIRAVPTGPSVVESANIDLLHLHYSLPGFIRHGLSAIDTVEVRSANVVLNPAKAPRKVGPAPREKKLELPGLFPDRLLLSNVTVIVRDHPHDFAMKDVDLSLNTKSPGELKIGGLQLVGGQSWSNISAATDYAGKKLVLRDLVLSEEERIRSLTVDASRIKSGQLAINLDYPVGGGQLTAAIDLTEEQAALQTAVRLQATNIPAGMINKYVSLPEDFVRGRIEKLDVDLSGVSDSPNTWTGHVSAQINDFHAQPITFQRGVFRVSAKSGTATIESGEIVQGKNEVHLKGSAELPQKVKDFGRARASLNIVATMPDLGNVTADMPQKLSGSAEVSGKIDINGGKLGADLVLTADSLASVNGSVQKVAASLKVSKPIEAVNQKTPWFAGLVSQATLTMTDLRFREYAADTVEGTLHGKDDVVAFDRLVVRRKDNEFRATGEYRLPDDLHKAREQPARIEIALNASNVGEYWATDSKNKISGPLRIYGRVGWKNGDADGWLSIYGANLEMNGLVVREISAQGTVASSVIYLNDFTANLNEHDFASVHATFDLHAPHPYTGKIVANVENLKSLEPVLRASGNQKELGGSFALNWEGRGDGKKLKRAGKLKLELKNGRYGDVRSVQANVDASYSPESLEVPIIFVGSDKMSFQAIAQAKDETFEITKIQLDQGKAKYASGYVSIPFVWRNLGKDQPLLPPNGQVEITFQSENLDLKKLFEDLGMKPPVSGTVNVKMDAHGTLADLDGRFDLQMRDLRSLAIPKFEPASLDLNATVQDSQLKILGKLQQTKIQPLELTANLPFDTAKIARARGLPDDTPITAKLQLPRSSVNFIRQFAPALQQIDGDVALDVDVNGTIGQPILSGSGDMTINVARSTNVTVPALTDFKARLEFDRDALTVQQFGGDLSGGKFTVSGGLKFPKLTEPVIDLAIKADSALVARNDTVTVRADADIKIEGPLNSANVTGTVSTTNSQVLKNIDLIPIGLPGRPPPQPSESRPDFSFPIPPVRDWKFDVAIKTKEPFRIRGNLAYGSAIADLHLTGTGLRPALDGMVRLENVEATLPFSRLDIGYGFLYFNPSDPLNPKIDLHGTSVIRDYTIHVYLYGTTLAPEAVFTSEPPLPQEEIISLLATGATREELTGNNNVLAGRAATLLVQQLYRKIFKKGGGTQNTSVFDRLDLDVGQTDPRTGQQQVTARFKVNDQFVLLGDLDVGGGFKGMVKYLIRFH